MRRIFPYVILTFLTLISTFILWLPFKILGLKDIKQSFLVVYQQYDGPLYIIPAKTLYNPKEIEKLRLEIPTTNKYFAAHLPLYPILIRLAKETNIFGKLAYPKAMISVNLLATIGLVLFFYYLLNKFKLTKHPLLLASILLFLPRFLVTRSVGAPESLFMFLILLSIFFFEKNKYWLAGLFGGLATMTKTPGILLFIAYGLVFVEKLFRHSGNPDSVGSVQNQQGRFWSSFQDKRFAPQNDVFSWQWLGIVMIPIGALSVFGLYGIQYGDFLAYFHSGDNIHLVYPFSVFNFRNLWVGTAWLEDVIFYFFIYGLSVYYLKEYRYRSFFYFSLVFFTATIFVQHRDISRYSLPLWPMAMIAFEKFFTSKKFVTIGIILLPAIFLFAWNVLFYNVMPISDWRPFL